MNEGLGLYCDDSVEILSVFGSPFERHHLHLQYHEDFFKPNLMHQMPSAAAWFSSGYTLFQKILIWKSTFGSPNGSADTANFRASYSFHSSSHDVLLEKRTCTSFQTIWNYEFLEFLPKKKTKRASSTYPFLQNPSIHGPPTLSNTAQKPPNGAGAPWPKKSRTKKVKPGKSVPTTAAIWWVDFHTPSTHHVTVDFVKV